MAAEWEAAAMGMDLGMGIRHNTTMPPPPQQQPLMGHHFYGGGGPVDAMLDFFPMPGGATSSSTPSSGSCSFNLSFAGDDEFSIPVPREEAAGLEWLSNFVDDSYPDMPPSYPPEVQAAIAAAAQQQPQQQRPNNSNNCSVACTGARTKRSRQNRPGDKQDKEKEKDYSSPDNNNNNNGQVRRCTHCASEKTPQWRTGPLGPKTLCNACGVRYKSGRLVPEYRPAASPTFVLTQHSNSHRKVMELRRQKDIRATTTASFRDYATLC